MRTTFLLNGERVTAEARPETTLLDWLREVRGLTGTKEGCNEGDCGACTVLVADGRGPPAPRNACLTFLPQLHGRAVRTVEGLGGPGGALHPVQQALVDHHASQCGFCTPGFAAAMAAAHAAGRTDFADALAGNLCRCTGYAPILRAARAAAARPPPGWIAADAARLADPGFFVAEIPSGGAGGADGPPGDGSRGSGGADGPPGTGAAGSRGADAPPARRPASADELAAWCLAHPGGTLVAGATDAGLRVNKDLGSFGPVAFIADIPDLSGIDIGAGGIRIGAAATIAALRAALSPLHPGLGELLRRFGSEQVRAAATVGGNIANGSPVGDTPPALIALGATLHLRRGDERRAIPLERFFLAYRRQDRRPGEFVEAVSLPREAGELHCHKLTKRFDQDIATVLACAFLRLDRGRIAAVRLAFGGMAGIPARAPAAEAALLGRAPDAEAAAAAGAALAQDFAPISDHRGSAAYRMAAARGLLARILREAAQGRPPGAPPPVRALDPLEAAP